MFISSGDDNGPRHIRSVKIAMQIPFDNFFADWKTDQIRVPMNPA
jgi:hypothetical protein